MNEENANFFLFESVCVSIYLRPNFISNRVYYFPDYIHLSWRNKTLPPNRASGEP